MLLALAAQRDCLPLPHVGVLTFVLAPNSSVPYAFALRTGPDGLFKGYDGKLTVGILPCSQFSSGHVFFVQVGVAWVTSQQHNACDGLHEQHYGSCC